MKSKPQTFRIDERLRKKIIDHPYLLKAFSWSGLIEYCMLKQLPILLKKIGQDGTDLILQIEQIKRIKERQKILTRRKEATKKLFFLQNLFNRLRKVLKSRVPRDMLSDYIKIYIEESKTYPDNERVTKIIEKLHNMISNSSDLTPLYNYLNLDIKILNEKEETDKYKLNKLKKVQ